MYTSSDRKETGVNRERQKNLWYRNTRKTYFEKKTRYDSRSNGALGIDPLWQFMYSGITEAIKLSIKACFTY